MTPKQAEAWLRRVRAKLDANSAQAVEVRQEAGDAIAAANDAGVPVGEIVRIVGKSQATVFAWQAEARDRRGTVRTR